MSTQKKTTVLRQVLNLPGTNPSPILTPLRSPSSPIDTNTTTCVLPSAPSNPSTHHLRNPCPSILGAARAPPAAKSSSSTPDYISSRHLPPHPRTARSHSCPPSPPSMHFPDRLPPPDLFVQVQQIVFNLFSAVMPIPLPNFLLLPRHPLLEDSNIRFLHTGSPTYR